MGDLLGYARVSTLEQDPARHTSLYRHLRSAADAALRYPRSEPSDCA